jgi:hypothetical protein
MNIKSVAALVALTTLVGDVGCVGDEGSEEDVSAVDEELARGSQLPAYGMNYGGLNSIDYHVEKLAAHHMAIERAWWGWNPVDSPDVGNFVTSLDDQVRTAANAHVSVLPIIFMARTIMQNGVAAPVAYMPSTDRALWKSFVNSLVVRFGPKTHSGAGAFWREHPDVPYLPIRAWEIWNEENTEQFWYGTPSPSDYYDALAVAHASLRSVDPEARVIFGGLLGFNNEPHNALEFLGHVTHMPNGHCLFDAVAVHPYASTADKAVANVRRMHAELKQLKLVGGSSQADVGIWVTEIGWAVGGPWESNVDKVLFTVPNEHIQAQYVSSFAAAMDRHRGRWGIGPTIWFNYQDLTGTPDSWDHHAGFFTIDSTGQPMRARRSWILATQAAGETKHVSLPPVRCSQH